MFVSHSRHLGSMVFLQHANAILDLSLSSVASSGQLARISSRSPLTRFDSANTR